MKHIPKLILLAVLLFASCKNPVGNSSVPSSPQQGGGSTPAQITITVAGDEHVVLKAEKTFTADKGNTWHQLKAQAEDRIDQYAAGRGPDKWKLTDASGQNLTDAYLFNTNTTVLL